ncbi:NADH dehydrogenase [ubiquinone] 1 beta subcomplex subunit 11, mitochondrial isoform X1 [Rhinoderma darwinii]|uniref:NADH dehydrogenase [ubiquinone] 1 beta subcomplex subunit 11, mitochondrial isoform X1 n=1 Tax=Rhinoderma darwinii TaxID=43563 RepID=UPI003F6739F2
MSIATNQNPAFIFQTCTGKLKVKSDWLLWATSPICLCQVLYIRSCGGDWHTATGCGAAPFLRCHNKAYQNPDWHGFSDDPVQDLRNMRVVFFFGVSVCLVLGTIFIYYSPERGMRDWAQREAERQIKRRQALGLPLIEMNYYDPETLVLPPEDK